MGYVCNIETKWGMHIETSHGVREIKRIVLKAEKNVDIEPDKTNKKKFMYLFYGTFYALELLELYQTKYCWRKTAEDMLVLFYSVLGKCNNRQNQTNKNGKPRIR